MATKRKEPTEAEIQAMIAADPDDFEPTDEEAANAMSFAEFFSDLAPLATAAIKQGLRLPLSEAKVRKGRKEPQND